MRRSPKSVAPAAVFALLIAVPGFQSSGRNSTSNPPTDAANARAGSTQSAGPWKSLVDGNSLAAWRGYKTDSMPAGWRAENGVLMKDRPVADIISREQFADFELSLEWRISEGGNAGIFYRGTEEYTRIYWSAPEYQLLDDAKTADGRNPLTQAATIYGLYPRTGGSLKLPGEWNETRIVARGPHVEHWLNGVKVAESEFWSSEWTAKVKGSKFDAYPNYGLAKRGHLALQGDHSGSLAFRNVRIREFR